MIKYQIGDSSIGLILVVSNTIGIYQVSLGNHTDLSAELSKIRKTSFQSIEKGNQSDFDKVISLIQYPHQYKISDSSLFVTGTDFQMKVWKTLRQIPVGITKNYTEIAESLGKIGSTRAVASACAANKLAIVIPCHRVIRKNGELSGYRWGVERKKKLLELEGVSCYENQN